MANWQLGQKSVALAALASGDQAAPRFSTEQDTKDLGESWIAWLFARISLDEATALIQSVASPSTQQ
jgi:chemotaxis regulatin CheY-phosphate phosphatase CheZ